MTEGEFWKDKDKVREAYIKFLHPYDPDISVWPVDHEPYFIAGWNACKEEILEVIERRKGFTRNGYVITPETLLEEIEKL